MDAQYPFASREDIWRVIEEVKDLYATQLEHGERIARLERRRDEDARLRSVWGPLSPFPSSVGGPLQPELSYTPTVDAFKGFDQGQQHGLINNMSLDSEDEPRRGASRANSVRFDESAIHGYYGQVNRSSSELPLRTGSSMSTHPLTERSLSHRSDGRQSSSGHSHHSARTNSLGLDAARLVGSSSASPLNTTIPPPGLFLLGPVPCIIRCWLTTNFSNDSLLYAVVCSGSYTSFLCYPLIEKLGLEEHITVEDGVRCIKLPLYLPEASIHQTSSRASSPTPQLPSVTIRFVVREVDPDDKCIQIFVGSDVLRSHNADILFSQDKIIMVDDERNKVSIPLVRPENDSVFKSLCTVAETFHPDYSGRRNGHEERPINGHGSVGVIAPPTSSPPQEAISTSSAKSTTESEEPVDHDRHRSAPSEDEHESHLQSAETKSSGEHEAFPAAPAKTEAAGVWGSWRRDSKGDPSAIGMAKSTRGRTMKVLRPSKSSSSRVASNTPQSAGAGSEPASSQVGDAGRPAPQSSPASGLEIVHPTPSRSTSFKSGDGPWSSKSRTTNPVGGASAFGWLNPSQPSKPTATSNE
ncbi:hypothetical protein VTN77DRAFT_6189 [Rasamsonia byssochlamydoides]|uniref:uncharacterized protein n=1 Tax=Rasamsonia byssochlamydoides TaxID=89139 RepID=UPI003743CA20